MGTSLDNLRAYQVAGSPSGPVLRRIPLCHWTAAPSGPCCLRRAELVMCTRTPIMISATPKLPRAAKSIPLPRRMADQLRTCA